LGAQHKDTVELRRDLAAFLREHDREAEARLVENESEAPMKSGAGGG
jgi:hypothetical protein